MKLYYSPGDCSLSPHIMAREAEVACELVRVKLQDHTLDDGSDFYAINPLGYVPYLLLDTTLNWARHAGLDLQGLPRLQAYHRRVARRPAVQAAMQAEGLTFLSI
ncbi:hypothetical protein ACL9RI_25165 [Janthinobacterium sp. Mn2066]|uniref:hypothetical protein n=1 Tax=Janthinobacterium sp. Mn2066 TaxID=3395264 RepID=UPI003BDF302A